MLTFLNDEHKRNYRTLELVFKPNSNSAKVFNVVFSIPGIHRRFEYAFQRYNSLIDLAVNYLDGVDDEINNIRIGNGELYMIQLAMQLYNGTYSYEKGGFQLYNSLSEWDDSYVRLFLELIQIIKPSSEI